MATVINSTPTPGYPLTLSTGRALAVGDPAVNVDLNSQPEASYLAAGLVKVVDANASPPAPNGHLARVAALVPAGAPADFTLDLRGAAPTDVLHADGSASPGSSGTGSSGVAALGPVGTLDGLAFPRVQSRKFYPHVGPMAGDADVVLHTDFTSEADALRKGIFLSQTKADYFAATRASDSSPKHRVGLRSGRWLARGWGPSAGDKALMIPLVGEFVQSRGWAIGTNLRSQPEGGGDLIVVESSVQGELLHVSGTVDPVDGGGLTAVMKGVGQMQCYTGAIPADKMPDGSWLHPFVTYNGVDLSSFRVGMYLADGSVVLSNPANNTASQGAAPVSEPTWGRIVFGGRGESGGCTSEMSGGYLLDGPRTPESFRIVTAPGVAADTATALPARATGGRLGGVLDQTQTDIAEAIRQAPGTGFARIGDFLDLVDITDRGAGQTPRYAYDFSALDAQISALRAGGIERILFGVGYTPPVLQGSGGKHAGPTDNNLFAEIVSTSIGHIFSVMPATEVAGFPKWNEPSVGYYIAGSIPTQGGAVSEFTNTWTVSQTRLVADFPNQPKARLGTPDGVPGCPFTAAVLTAAQTASLPVGCLVTHIYNSDVQAVRRDLRALRAAATAAAVPTTVPLLVGEWNTELALVGETFDGYMASTEKLEDYYRSPSYTALLFALMCAFDAEGVQGAAYTRLGGYSGFDGVGSEQTLFGLFDGQTHGHPAAAYAALQAMWLLGDASRVQAVSNTPNVYAAAAKATDGSVTLALGSYRRWHPDEHRDIAVTLAGLPNHYTWRQLAADAATVADGRLRVIGSGDQTNLPTSLFTEACGVSVLQITAGS